MRRSAFREALDPLARLLPRLTHYRKYVALIFTMLLLHRVCGTVLNVLGAALVSHIMLVNHIDGIVWWALVGLAVLVLSVGVTWWLDMWFAHVYSYRIIADLRIEIFDAIDRINPSGLQNRTTGDVTAAAMSDVEITEWFYAHTVIDFLATVTVNVIFAIVMVALVGPSGMILLITTTAILLVPMFTLPLQARQGERIRQSLASQKSRSLEMIQGSREIISLGLIDRQLDVIRESTLEVQRRKRWYIVRSGIEIAVSQLMISVATIGTLAWLLTLNQAGSVELVHIPSAMTLLSASCKSCLSLSSMLRKLGEVSGATRRFFELVDMPQQIPDNGEPVDFPNEALDIEYRSLTFGYTEDVKILDDFSLSIPAGSSVALVGRSGVGKSTMAALTARLYQPQSGSICIGGRPIDSIPLGQLRTLVTLVPQHPYIFRSTVRDNLRMAKPSASDNELWQALEIAQLDETIRALPNQLDTLIGERGATLSGGQRQRLSLAQTFLKNSPIVIFDEAVSNLDPNLEQKLVAAGRFMYESRTVITIAHRLSTIRSADSVAFIEDGKLSAVGTHEQLLRDCPRYRAFMEPVAGLHVTDIRHDARYADDL